MDFFLPGTFALIYVLIGMLLGEIARTLRATPDPPEDPPVPLDDPQRSPDYCHSHNQPWPCDGCPR